MPVKQESVLQEADRLVSTDRQEEYGHPLDNYQDVAAGWQVIFKYGITPANCALAMVWLKITRELHRQKRDNRVDGAGYFKVEDMILEEEEKRNVQDGQATDRGQVRDMASGE